jgi:hypothetical protein
MMLCYFSLDNLDSPRRENVIIVEEDEIIL